MDNQLLHYSEIQDEPEAEQVIDVGSLYSISNSDFSAEEFLENSLSKEIGILEEQIASCREELKERERLHERQIKDLKEKAQECRSGLTNPIEMKRLAKGDNLGEQKANLSEKIGTIEERVREEERENWKDTQELKDRMRDLEMEQQKLKKRKRFMQFYADRL